MKWRPYPRYKPSGVEWLGEVPEHWEVLAFRRVIVRLDQGWSPNASSWPAAEDEWGVLKLSAVRDGNFVPSENKAFSDTDVPEGIPLTPEARDLLISRSNTPERVGEVCFVSDDHPRRLIPDLLYRVKTHVRRSDPRYVCYFLRSKVARAQIESDARGSSGSMVKIGQEHVRSWLIPCPSLEEQSQIVTFLDMQMERVGFLISCEQTLIERLREKRSALISRTVTRGLPADAGHAAGLDPEPKLKPSGVEWLGNVPEHWRLSPLGFNVRFCGGGTPDKARSDYWDGPIPWVSPKDMKRARISDAEDHVSEHALRESPITMIPPGAVLVVVRGMILAHSFPVALTEAPVTINQDMKAMLPRVTVEPRFLAWVLTGISRPIVALADESAHGTRKLESTTLSKLPMVLPPVVEQRAIVDYLDRETSQIDRLIAKIEEAIERLQEYRSALITAVVTGKIDVRDAAEALPPAATA